MTETLPISAIDVGVRHRQDLGDLDELVDSIVAVGLLHPIVVTADRRLVAGARRLAACERLGMTEVPVTITTTLLEARDRLAAEAAENTCRLDMKMSEKVALGRELEKLERPKASDRHREGSSRGGRRLGSGEPSLRTQDVVAPAVGLSSTTYTRAKAVVAAAEAGKPEAIEALAEMDATGRVNRPYEKATGRDLYPSKKKPKRKRKETKLAEHVRPLHRYLKAWDESTFKGMTPPEARRLLKLVGETSTMLLEVERALDARATVTRALR